MRLSPHTYIRKTWRFGAARLVCGGAAFSHPNCPTACSGVAASYGPPAAQRRQQRTGRSSRRFAARLLAVLARGVSTLGLASRERRNSDLQAEGPARRMSPRAYLSARAVAGALRHVRQAHLSEREARPAVRAPARVAPWAALAAAFSEPDSRPARPGESSSAFRRPCSSVFLGDEFA